MNTSKIVQWCEHMCQVARERYDIAEGKCDDLECEFHTGYVKAMSDLLAFIVSVKRMEANKS